MGSVGLCHPHGVEYFFGFETEHVFVAAIAHGQRETICLGQLVDEYRIRAIVPLGQDGKWVWQLGYVAHELVVGVNRVVQRAIHA